MEGSKPEEQLNRGPGTDSISAVYEGAARLHGV